MAKHAGKDMLIYLGDGASPEVFSLIVGLRSKSFSINNEQIDVTDSDDSRWRKLLEGGARSCSLSGSGLLQSQRLSAAGDGRQHFKLSHHVCGVGHEPYRAVSADHVRGFR